MSDVKTDSIDEVDLRDALCAFVGAMRVIREAHDLIASDDSAGAYFVLGRAIKADDGVLDWDGL